MDSIPLMRHTFLKFLTDRAQIFARKVFKIATFKRCTFKTVNKSELDHRIQEH